MASRTGNREYVSRLNRAPARCLDCAVYELQQLLFEFRGCFWRESAAQRLQLLAFAWDYYAIGCAILLC